MTATSTTTADFLYKTHYQDLVHEERVITVQEGDSAPRNTSGRTAQITRAPMARSRGA